MLLPQWCPTDRRNFRRNFALTGRTGGEGERLGEPLKPKGETEVLWIVTFPFFCFSNVIVNKIKSENHTNEPKCFFSLLWEQPHSLTLASCSLSTQVLRSNAGMQSFTFSLQVCLIKEALCEKHFSPVLINQINKNKKFCQAVCFCSYPSTGLK